MRALLLGMPNSVFFFNHFAILPNLGICSIAGNVDEDHKVNVADLVLAHRTYDHFLREKIQQNPPDLIGLSSMSFQSKTARMIARMVKTIDPNIKVALGGYHASLLAEEVLKRWGKDLDFIIKGEGEKTFNELLNNLEDGERDLEHIDGLSFRKGEKIIHNNWREISELSSLNLPSRSSRLLTDGFHIWGRKADVVETSRGCVYNCEYCSIRKMYGKAFRKYDIDRVLDDIEACKREGAEAIFFADDNITLYHNHFINLCNGIIERGLNDIHYTTQAHVGRLYDEPIMIEKAIDANFKTIFLGIENPNQKKLQDLGKEVSNMAQKAKAVVSTFRNSKVITIGGLIVGNIQDKPKDFLNVLSYVKQLKMDATIFFSLTPYPGTKIREKLIEKGLVKNLHDYSNYDALSANVGTEFLTKEQVELLTEYLYDNFLSVKWIFETNIGRNYPWYFLKVIKNFSPRIIKKLYYKIHPNKTYVDLLREMISFKKKFRDIR
ncbi:MAG: putative Radical SAM domain protein [Promethearchaeota archaeon]|nr:MAG: putative Radical SAM domain protein [Candidatus Lokiarchaeota archaeon]